MEGERVRERAQGCTSSPQIHHHSVLAGCVAELGIAEKLEPSLRSLRIFSENSLMLVESRWSILRGSHDD